MRLMEGGAVLVDSTGAPIPPGETRKAAEEELKNFMEKNKKLFEDFWRENGFGSRPPIKFDSGNRRWLWVGE